MFAETKTNEEKEIYVKILWGSKFYHKNEKERAILQTLSWIFTFSYNTTIAFLYIISYYSQQIWKIISHGRPQLHKGMEIPVFINSKIICIRRFTLHFLLFSFAIKNIQTSCIIKATRALVYYCAIDKQRILRIERWGSNGQKLLDRD